jgi:hypothetical protein
MSLALLLTSACGKSDSGGPIEAVCEDFCDVANVCNDTEPAIGQCNRKCVEVFDKVIEDGDPRECTDANLASFICATNLACGPGDRDLKEFLATPLRSSGRANLQVGKYICDTSNDPMVAIDCCEAELETVIVRCPKSFRFAPGG